MRPIMNPRQEHFKNTNDRTAPDGPLGGAPLLFAPIETALADSRTGSCQAGREARRTKGAGPRLRSFPMPIKPDDKEETKAEAPHVAKVGVVDTGHNVTSFNEEPINGLLADI